MKGIGIRCTLLIMSLSINEKISLVNINLSDLIYRIPYSKQVFAEFYYTLSVQLESVHKYITHDTKISSARMQ